MRAAAILALLTAIPLVSRASFLGGGAEPQVSDLIVRNGMVVDGTGAPAFRADLSVRNGRIDRIGDLAGIRAKEEIDARGLVVAPGFIDVHTHADDLAERPLAENFLRMGVTTLVAGNCGSSSIDLAETFRRIESTGVSVHFATLIGHNTVRSEVMGASDREPAADELERMRALVARAMDEGAVGFSTGLQYVPGVYAAPEEILALARTACRQGGVYASHMRNEGTAIEAAIEETIRVGESAGCRVEISHLKIDAKSLWGRSAEALALIDRARERGLEVQADQYAYTAAGSSLGIRFPAWVLEGGQEAIDRRLDDPSIWERIRGEMKEMLAERGFEDLSWAVVSSYGADPSRNGLSIQEIARRTRGSGELAAQLEVARDMLRAGGARMVYHLMSEDDVVRILRHPHVAVASDSFLIEHGVGSPHPRGYGNNARVLGHYVRQKKAIPLEEAVRKMTSLPAAHFGLEGRGLLRQGQAADLVVFDPESIAAPASFAAPHAYPVGIPWVVVAGEIAVRRGEHTGARSGRVLRRATR